MQVKVTVEPQEFPEITSLLEWDEFLRSTDITETSLVDAKAAYGEHRREFGGDDNLNGFDEKEEEEQEEEEQEHVEQEEEQEHIEQQEVENGMY